MAGGLWDPDPFREPVGGDEWGGGSGGGGFIPPGPVPGPGPSPYPFGSPSGSRPTFAAPGYGGMRNRRRAMRGAQMPGGLPQYQTQQAPQTAREGDGGSYFDALMGRFGGTPDQPWSHAAGTDAEALLDLIIAGKAGGAWGPGGDPGIMEAYDADAGRQGRDLEESMVLGADLEGGDFWNRGLARTLARGNAQRRRGDFMNQNRLRQADRYGQLQDFALRHKVGEYDTQRSRESYLADRDHDARRQNAMAPWQIGGDIAGRALGAWAGGGSGMTTSRRGDEDFTRYNYMGSGRNYR